MPSCIVKGNQHKWANYWADEGCVLVCSFDWVNHQCVVGCAGRTISIPIRQLFVIGVISWQTLNPWTEPHLPHSLSPARGPAAFDKICIVLTTF